MFSLYSLVLTLFCLSGLLQVTPVVFAVLDFAIPGETAIEYPQSYLHGPDGGHFGIIVYLKYILSAVWHGAVSVLIPYCVLGIQFWDGYGKVSYRFFNLYIDHIYIFFFL